MLIIYKAEVVQELFVQNLKYFSVPIKSGDKMEIDDIGWSTADVVDLIIHHFLLAKYLAMNMACINLVV